MDACVKEEALEIPIDAQRKPRNGTVSAPPPDKVIELSSSSSSSDSDSDVDLDSVVAAAVQRGVSGGSPRKKRKTNDLGVVLPVGFLSPLSPPLPPQPPEAVLSLPAPTWASASAARSKESNTLGLHGSKQFWKAGDYDGAPSGGFESSTVGMDHVRVHPKFLHSNATSHKWALGAFAELLDNALDEVCNGATYVNIDMLVNKKDGTRMLLIEDNGGGMDPDKMRQCMSLGYSVKSKMANTIGQYGNGFKTSTMRLGADVIVFSRYLGKDGNSSTQSIGLLSYTFLRSTGKEDIVVPMLDYEREGQEWNRVVRTSVDDWNKNVETVVQWSPFSNEADLLRQFNLIKDHGTRVIIYNLWEDDQGQLELDFDADPHDIQIRGVNRDEKNIRMAQQYPNSRHFLTYRHSLRSYTSILYLRLPPGFRIILRGEDVLHHNIVNDMMYSQEVTYRPQSGTDGVPKDSNMVAVVTIGFVKDAVHHIDVSGFNVYHKNRLIKACGKQVLLTAHDKQGFVRTIVLSRLELRLIQMQKNYCLIRALTAIKLVMLQIKIRSKWTILLIKIHLRVMFQNHLNQEGNLLSHMENLPCRLQTNIIHIRIRNGYKKNRKDIQHTQMDTLPREKVGCKFHVKNRYLLMMTIIKLAMSQVRKKKKTKVSSRKVSVAENPSENEDEGFQGITSTRKSLPSHTRI